MAKAEEGGSDLLVLDACCVINLFASGRAEQILQVTAYRCAVAEYVARREALGLAAEGEEVAARQPVDLAPLVDAGLLEVRHMTSADEQREFVRFAVDLDDGEAWTCAFARVHDAAVATDDRKALRLLEREEIPTVQTAELLRGWAERTKAGAAEIRDALARIEARASFRPRRSAPEAEWWYRQMGV